MKSFLKVRFGKSSVSKQTNNNNKSSDASKFPRIPTSTSDPSFATSHVTQKSGQSRNENDKTIKRATSNNKNCEDDER